jgi:hypothetical protein
MCVRHLYGVPGLSMDSVRNMAGTLITLVQAEFRGFKVPGGNIPGVPLNSGSMVSFCITGLEPNTTYTLVAIAHCDNASGCILPYLSGAQEVAFPPVNFTTSASGGGGGGGNSGMHKGLGIGAIAGIVTSCLVGAALIIGVANRCLQKSKLTQIFDDSYTPVASDHDALELCSGASSTKGVLGIQYRAGGGLASNSDASSGGPGLLN